MGIPIEVVPTDHLKSRPLSHSLFSPVSLGRGPPRDAQGTRMLDDPGPESRRESQSGIQA